MTWTTELPTVMGHYWWVFGDAPPTVLKLDDGGEWFKPGCAGPFIPPSQSQFAGPISCPRILLEPLPDYREMTDGIAGGVSNAQAFAYQGEDTGMTVQFPDGSGRWIRAGEYEFDYYT